MIEADLDIVGSFNTERFSQYSAERTINLYEEYNEGGKKTKALLPTPGYESIQSPVTRGNVRQLFDHKLFLYSVIGNVIYRTDEIFFYNNIMAPAQLTTSSGFVSIDANEANEIIFADGVAGYIYNEDTSVFTKITDPNFPKFPTCVIYFDGYFIANNYGTAQFNVSQTNKGLVWSPQRQFSITSAPDAIVGFAALNNRLLIFGSKITEVWYSNPRPNQLANNPILPDKNILINIGCASLASIAEGYGVVVWLSNNEQGNHSVVMSEGGRPTNLSDHQFEYEISQYSDVTDATAYLYKINGHLFYQITFPSVNRTWQFDLNLKKIHQIEGYGGNRFPANCHAYFNQTSKHIVGDYQSSQLYEMSSNFYDYDGQTIKHTRIGKHLIDTNYHRIRIIKVQIDLVNGIADANGQDSDPSMFLGISDDGGITFKSYLRGSVSKIGQFKKRIIWYRLGSFSRDIVFKLDFYHALPFVVLGASITYDVKPK
jgi:hypothetical protein